ncbi:MAG: hypothetical protein AABY18_07400 [Candidatus Thermoplasmatota archaeon]
MASAPGFFKQAGVGRVLVSDFLVASVLTIIPALAFLFYLLNRYEGYFEDARVFFSLTVGFFVGLVVAFLENVAFAFDSDLFIAEAGAGTAFLMFVGGYALVEAAGKTVVLGTAKFRKRKDTPYYGAALGIGFGAMVGLQAVALGLRQTALMDRSIDADWALTLALIVLSASGSILTAGATGVWIGKGAAEGKLWRGLVHGSLLTMPVLACLWFFRPAPALVPAIAAFLYGAGLVVWTQRRILDKVVPPEIRDQVLKERRREARREERAAQAEPVAAPVASPPSDVPPTPTTPPKQG